MLKALSGKVEEAIRKAPSVFFLDELDSFTRRNNPGRSSDYIVGVVNGLLEHLSRLNDVPGVVVLAATNFPHLVDPAVIRPGRFDLHLEIGNPDRQSIIRILEHALEGDAASIDLSTITDQLLGTSGAQVVAVVREAKGLARMEAAGLSQSHLSTAADRVCPPLDQALLWRAAVHEAGHLVAAHLLNLPAPVSAIIGAAGGAVDIPASRLENRKTAENRTAALLAGRAAEIVIFGSATNGAGLGQNSDLSIATELAEKVFYEWGLDEQLAFTPLSHSSQKEPGTQATAKIDHYLNEQMETAIRTLSENKTHVVRIAEALVTERELKAKRLTELLQPLKKPNESGVNVCPSGH